MDITTLAAWGEFLGGIAKAELGRNEKYNLTRTCEDAWLWQQRHRSVYAQRKL